jgi:hypothetical protein
MANVIDGILPAVIQDVLPSLTGQDVILRRTVQGAYNPETGTDGADSITDYPITSVSPITEYSIHAVNGDTIQMGDAKIALAAKGIPVVPDAREYSAIVDGRTWLVVRVTKHFSGAEPVLYELHLR